jgi:hypothetical protein
MMKTFVIFCAFIQLLSNGAAVETEEKLPMSVKYDTASGKYNVVKEIDVTYDSYGYYYPNLNSSGWNYIDLTMSSFATPPPANQYIQKSNSLGYLEGYLTCNTIYVFYPNFYSAVFGTSQVGNSTLTFLEDNYNWLMEMSKENGSKDEYWFTVQNVLAQINGMYEGFKDGCSSVLKSTDNDSNPWNTLDQPTLLHFLLINAWGDLYQITMKYREVGNPVRLALAKQYAKKFEEQLKTFERCSAIVKVLPDSSDIVFGHATWDTYESLGPRFLKQYSKPQITITGQLLSSTSHVYFSSSPALLSSIDDFFVTNNAYGSNIGVIETTNSLYNVRLLDKVVPQSVLSWTRAVVSNQIAGSGSDWGRLFSRYQSGTYTNQWMAIDFNLFIPGQPLKHGLFTVFEEVPGLVHVEDQTEKLAKDGYWGSYNVPYYQDISEASGYAKLCSVDADQCHDTCPRANLFREYQSQITNLDGGKWILAYNSYQNDTASKSDPCNAIACRGDLYEEKSNQGAFGALDVKVTSIQKARVGYNLNHPQISARLGPTHDQQPFFCWSQIEDKGYVHQGQPDCYNFDYTIFPPAN